MKCTHFYRNSVKLQLLQKISGIKFERQKKQKNAFVHWVERLDGQCCILEQTRAIRHKGIFFGMTDHRDAEQCSNIISSSLFFGEIGAPANLLLLCRKCKLR